MPTPDKPFAKIFDLPEFGQALVTRSDTDDGAPCVTVEVRFSDLGVCQMSIGVVPADGATDEDAERRADRLFDQYDEHAALRAARMMVLTHPNNKEKPPSGPAH